MIIVLWLGLISGEGTFYKPSDAEEAGVKRPVIICLTFKGYIKNRGNFTGIIEYTTLASLCKAS